MSDRRCRPGTPNKGLESDKRCRLYKAPASGRRCMGFGLSAGVVWGKRYKERLSDTDYKYCTPDRPHRELAWDKRCTEPVLDTENMEPELGKPNKRYMELG